jgi:metal-dependent hydrolase (beta-lactamase superfamily II)
MVGGSLIHELNNLDAGVDDIDAVLFSHRHADHMGWLATDTASGPKLTFGSAEHVLHRISPITCSVAWCQLAALATSPVSIQIQLI